MSVFSELRRRNVIRVAVAYLVTAWLVAQVAELALDSFGAPDWVMKTLIFLMAVGLPFALIFAWAFELTPEGLKREKDVDRSQSITRQTGRKLNFTIIGVLAIALVFSVATRPPTSSNGRDPAESVAASGNDEKSIAVLPFVNMSDDPNNEYFSDGISEELLNVLVKVEGLRVASRTSSFSFKGKDTAIPDIADALKVDHILEGSVRKAGDTVRITAQLIDVRTDSHLWSETYDRKLEDIFVIQDEISAHIVDALKVALGEGGGNPAQSTSSATEDLTAYEDFLKGRYFWQRRGETNIKKSIALFEHATRVDPDFARAWAGLAAAHLTLPVYSEEPVDTHMMLAVDYANKALALDPTIADAYSVLGDVSRTRDDYIGAEEYFRKAIDLEPKNSTAHLWYAEHLLISGMREKARKHADIARALDPLHPGTNAVSAAVYESLGDQEAREQFDLAAWEMGHRGALFDAIDKRIQAGDFDGARQLNERMRPQTDSRFHEIMDLTIRVYAEPADRPQILDELLARTRDRIQTSWMAVIIYTQIDDLDAAYDAAFAATRELNALMPVWRSDMGAFRSDPRFARIVASTGWIPYWDQYGWPSLCRRDGDSISCH